MRCVKCVKWAILKYKFVLVIGLDQTKKTTDEHSSRKKAIGWTEEGNFLYCHFLLLR